MRVAIVAATVVTRLGSVSVRATAVDAIGEIGSDNARPLLESSLADESAVVREAAIEQLGRSRLLR